MCLRRVMNVTPFNSVCLIVEMLVVIELTMNAK